MEVSEKLKGVKSEEGARDLETGGGGSKPAREEKRRWLGKRKRKEEGQREEL